MKKSRKISLIVIPIVILIALFFGSFSLQHFISSPTGNDLGNISVENSTMELSSLDVTMIGSSDAPVTIFAFNDYQCANCKYWYEKDYPEILKNLIETQKANIVFLDSTPLGNDSVLISQATFCADDQGKYSEYQKILFNSQQKIDDWAKSEQLKQFAIDLDLNQELFEECLDSKKYENKVLSNIASANNFGVEKIPLFKIVNFEGKEHIFKGGVPNTVFETIVNNFQ